LDINSIAEYKQRSVGEKEIYFLDKENPDPELWEMLESHWLIYDMRPYGAWSINVEFFANSVCLTAKRFTNDKEFDNKNASICIIFFWPIVIGDKLYAYSRETEELFVFEK